jgi:hypothetical protein
MSLGEGELPPAPRELVELPERTVLAVPSSGQRLYRLLGRELPRLYDFTSDKDKGRPRASKLNEVEHVGLSMWADADQAIAKARRRPVAVAEITLATGLGLSIARTFETEGHYTVWGSAHDLLGQVSSVHTED